MLLGLLLSPLLLLSFFLGGEAYTRNTLGVLLLRGVVVVRVGQATKAEAEEAEEEEGVDKAASTNGARSTAVVGAIVVRLLLCMLLLSSSVFCSGWGGCGWLFGKRARA